MAPKGSRETAIRYVDEAGEVSFTTAADLDLKRAARAAPEWRRHDSTWSPRPDVADSRGWAWGAAHLPHDRRVDPGRLWVAAFDPVERWIVARPIRGLDLGAVRRLVGETRAFTHEHPETSGSEPATGHASSRPFSCPTETIRGTENVRGNHCVLGVAWVGSLLHATAGGLEAVSRKLLNSSGWAW